MLTVGKSDQHSLHPGGNPTKSSTERVASDMRGGVTGVPLGVMGQQGSTVPLSLYPGWAVTQFPL